MTVNKFLLIMLCIHSLYAAENEYTVAQPVPIESLSHIKELAKKSLFLLEETIEELKKTEIENEADWTIYYKNVCLKSKIEMILESNTCYLIDINNDGKEKYVFLDDSLSLSAMAIVYEEQNSLNFVKIPSSFPDEIIPIFINPITAEEEIFITAGGETYIISNGHKASPSLCLWKNNILSYDLANKTCVRHQINQGKLLLDKKLYRKAFNFLYNFEKNIDKNKIDPEIHLWLKYNCASAALLDKRPRLASKIIKSIMSDQYFFKMTDLFHNEITTIKTKIEKFLHESHKSTKGLYDYTQWPLTDTLKYCFINAIIPDIYYAGDPQKLWRDHIKLFLKKYTFQLIKNRYVQLEAHLLEDYFFIWCDTNNQISLAATILMPEEDSFPNSILYITSRSVLDKEIPQEFYEALSSWMMKNNLYCNHALFYDRYNKGSILAIEVEKEKDNNPFCSSFF